MDNYGFQAACEACGWQAPLMLPSKRLALEAAYDHEYNKGCPAKGELSPTILGAMRADQIKQQVQHQTRRKRRENAARAGLLDLRRVN